MKKRLTLMIVIVAFFLGAYLISDLFRMEPPRPTIMAGKTKINFAQGSYCWSGFGKGTCSDMPSPPDIVKYQNLIPEVVPAQSPIKITFRNKPKRDTLGAMKWTSANATGTFEGVQVKNSELIVPKEKGVYTYSIYANWRRGSSSYIFVIEVK
ncbi:hypothetical protein [Paenibacillus qinlingensis]|uniref:Proteinase inhibitor I42 chagasin domain-containing protein n=1 Tax=Paenibacillus qinlingensis TaxID=1837343 RepID=A0ABU1NRA5_9BACL|nr:hypothetical protein [Paenibacillus qinlingensis]MDR6549889.1 hypothetical protein [Paenibacillus qinlingensis]